MTSWFRDRRRHALYTSSNSCLSGHNNFLQSWKETSGTLGYFLTNRHMDFFIGNIFVVFLRKQRPEKHGNNYKCCYLETLVSRSIEQYTGDKEYNFTSPHSLLSPPIQFDDSHDHECSTEDQTSKTTEPAVVDCEELVKIAKDHVFSLHIRQVKRVCEKEETFSSDESCHEDILGEFIPVKTDVRPKTKNRRRFLEESLNYHVVDYLRFPLALPNLKVGAFF